MKLMIFIIELPFRVVGGWVIGTRLRALVKRSKAGRCERDR